MQATPRRFLARVLVPLAVLAFLAQGAFAVAATCPGTEVADSAHHAMAEAGHGAVASGDDAAAAGEHGCCDSEARCFMAGCVAVPGAIAAFPAVTVATSPEPPSMPAAASPLRIPRTHFRPPIPR